MKLLWLFLPLLSSLALPAWSVRAEPLLAHYEIQAGGLMVLRLEVVFDLDGPRYRVGTRTRTAGLTGFLSGGDQLASTEGIWRGDEPFPDRYRTKGTWRGSRREVAIDWAPPRMPQLRALEPPNEAEREAVPQALMWNTVDALSALAKLVRTVAQTGRCETEAAVYDGRRRVDYSARTVGPDMLPPEGAFGGQALRCAFESRVLAGFRGDQDPAEARRTQPATAWLARLPSFRQPLPVRIELPNRWFGTIRVVLVGVEPAPPTHPSSGQDLVQQRR